MEVCIHSDVCGGCSYQGVPYEEQITIKQNLVKDLMDKAELFNSALIEIEAGPKRYQYRNKMEYTFGDEIKDGPMTLGLHKRRSFMSIITTDECQLVDPDFNLILKETLKFCVAKKYSHYNKKTHKGLLRHLVVRKGENTGELLVNIVVSEATEFDESMYVELLNGLFLDNTIVGILLSENSNLADAVNCQNLKILQGRDHYFDEILGLRFKVNAFSFFQTNVSAVETLYSEALSLLESAEGKTVFDLYSGTGTIAQIMSKEAKSVIGIELIEEAVEAATDNAKLNKIENCTFYAGDVMQILDTISTKPDVIIVDPPRSGIHPKAMNKILNYGVNQIIYISCNPKTMTENLVTARFSGYEITYLKAYDNFPFTRHVECVALISRVNP